MANFGIYHSLWTYLALINYSIKTPMGRILRESPDNLIRIVRLKDTISPDFYKLSRTKTIVRGLFALTLLRN